MDSSSFQNIPDKEGKSQEGNTQGEDEITTPDSRGKRKDVPSGSGDNCEKFKAKQPKQKKTLTPRSDVWQHFTRTKENNNKCKCHYCQKIFCCASTSGTSNLGKHLAVYKHHIAWQQKNQAVIDNEGKVKDAKISEDLFRQASNEMLVMGELPLAFIESMAWRHFCKKVNMYKPHSRRTVARDIVEMFVANKTSLKNWISFRQQRVSLTTDIWVAQATRASYMVITAHFVDDSWQLRKLIIGFRYITDHKGSTISSILLQCLAEWGIEKIFTITVDNATANTLAIKKFQRQFSLLRNDSLILDGDYMHMRCAAHIINLIVHEGLHELGENVTAIRNAVHYVRSFSSRCNSFETKVVSGKMTRGSLPLDIKTRWNSTYLMLTRAIKYKMAFDKMEAEDKLYNDYFMEVDNGKKRIGPPTSTDWRAIERLVKFLALFYSATMIVSASTSICWYKCFGEIATIEKNLMTMSKSLDKELRTKADDMRVKFEKYWDGMKHINKLLIIASVFDPRKKMEFAKMCFEKLYGKDSFDATEMCASVYDVMNSMFKEYSDRYKKVSSTQSSQSNKSASSSGQDHIHVPTDLEESYMQFESIDSEYKEMADETGIAEANNELDLYLKEKVENPKTMIGTEWDVLSWWKLNVQRFPILSEIAKDVLAMQVSSVASESAFSTCGRILEAHRSCLNHYMVEVLMCTQQWLKSDIQLSDKTVVTTSQLLAEVELLDNLEKEFEPQIN